MAKKIIIAPGIAVIFDQRARGQETPYWEGRILDVSEKKSGEPVATFENSGQGGPTHIRGLKHPVMVTLTDRTKAYFERHGIESPIEIEDIPIGYAELLGYELRCDCATFTFDDYMDLHWSDYGCSLERRQPTDDQKQRKQAANVKADRRAASAKAVSAAKRGKTLVAVNVNGRTVHYQYSTRDADAIRASLAKRGHAAEAVEILA